MRFEGNPTLRRVSRKGQESGVMDRAATVGGVSWKAAFMCLLVIASSIVTAYILQRALIEGNANVILTLSLIIVFSFIPMLIISFVIMAIPSTAPVLSVIYCILDGVLVGTISGLVDLYYPGIALLALLGTCVVFLVTLLIFRLLGNRVSNGFIRFVMIASFSMIILFFVGYLLQFAFPAISAMFATSPWLQIGISALCIVWATFILLIDLNSIVRMAEAGVDKKYEWLTAFSLTTTLVWLYVEILELLVKLVAIFGRNRN